MKTFQEPINLEHSAKSQIKSGFFRHSRSQQDLKPNTNATSSVAIMNSSDIHKKGSKTTEVLFFCSFSNANKRVKIVATKCNFPASMDCVKNCGW